MIRFLDDGTCHASVTMIWTLWPNFGPYVSGSSTRCWNYISAFSNSCWIVQENHSTLQYRLNVSHASQQTTIALFTLRRHQLREPNLAKLKPANNESQQIILPLLPVPTDKTATQSTNKSAGQSLEEFCVCPITMHIMDDPVIAKVLSWFAYMC